MRIRFVFALMVAGMLFAAGIASAQDTTTEPLSSYTSTTPTVTTQTTTTAPAQGQSSPSTSPSVQGQEQSNVSPSVAAQPAASSPNSLAFTGGEPLLLIALGLALLGGTATLLVRDRRRAGTDERR